MITKVATKEKNLTVTKRAARKQSYRNAILKAAEELFLEKGYSATSIDEIAARAGITKPTLYSYYPSKLALYTGLYKDYLHRLHHEQSKVEKLNLPGDQIFFKYFETHYKFIRKNEKFMRLFLWVLDSDEFNGNVPDELRNSVNEQTTKIRKKIADHYKRIDNGGKLFNIRPELLVHISVVIQKGIFSHASKKDSFKDAHINADILFNLFKIILKKGIFR